MSENHMSENHMSKKKVNRDIFLKKINFEKKILFFN
jgi:hypothetical protein